MPFKNGGLLAVYISAKIPFKHINKVLSPIDFIVSIILPQTLRIIQA